MQKSDCSRREFLKTAGLAALTAATSASLLPQARAAETTRSVVAIACDPMAVDAAWQIDAARTERLVHEAVMLLTGQGSPEAAWAAIFPKVKDTDVVGLKVNALNPACPSHVEVALGVAAGLQKAGFKENNIIIWDRAEGSFIEGLTMSGYKINRGSSGIRCLGTNSPSIGYDQRRLVTIPSIEKTMPVSRLVSQVCNYIVNIPVMKQHGIAGVTGCLKNFYGAIPLGDRVSLGLIAAVHANNANPQIAELYANAVIREKTRLHIADALMGIYEGGPHGKPQWRCNQIMASADPVALDFQMLQTLNAYRAGKGKRPLDPKAQHIVSAQKLGLGTCTPALIEVRQKTV